MAEQFGRWTQQFREVPNRRGHTPRTPMRPTGTAPHVVIPPPRPGTVQATLERLLPEDSSIMRSILAREPRNLFVNGNQPQGIELSFTDFSRYTNETPAGGSALIIQDVNIGWADFLLSQFDTSLSTTFFAKHMFRLDSSSISGETANEASMNLKSLRTMLRLHCPGTLLESSPASDDWLTVQLSTDLPTDLQNDKGFHVDCDLSSLTKRNPNIYYQAPESAKWDVFERHVSKDTQWRSIRTRISWCQLDQHLYLILVDSMPEMANGSGVLWNTTDENPFQRLLSFRIDCKSPLKIIRSPILFEPGYINTNNVHIGGYTHCIMTAVKRLVQHRTPDSIFNPQEIPCFRNTRAKHGKCHVFVWLLAATSWEHAVAALESNLQHLQRSASNKANDEAFELLRAYRRHVADAEVLTAGFKERLTTAFKAADEWYIRGEEAPIAQAKFWEDKDSALPTPLIFGQTQPGDVKNLLDMLKDLEGRVNATTQTVNEEIQVVIGSVQVEDAKIMKRQTEVTVVLAVLAAIYLPLTLVTGIFGMNISDISASNRPDWVWVIKTWSWIVSVTIALIAFYAGVRRLVQRIQDRTKSSKDKDNDLEALKLD